LADQIDAPKAFATVAIHPHEAEKATEADFAELERLSEHPKVLAWGEIGLDYFYDHSPREIQQQVFRRQMQMAEAQKLPIIIHCRPSQDSENAWDDTIAMLQEHWAETKLGGILHCFSGERRHAEAAIAMGFLISFAGNVSFPKAQSIRDAAAVVPLDRMLIETDSPYLAPIPHRGKRNEPALVAATAAHIGQLRGLSAEEIGQQTSQNFYRFFAAHEKINAL
jgi:TatD DNase family protein